MALLKSYVEVFKKVKQGAKVTREAIQLALSGLRRIDDGIEDKELHLLVDTFISDRLPVNSSRELMLNLAPKTTVSNEVIDKALVWLLNTYTNPKASSTKINCLLDWITSLLEYHLVDRKCVDGYYNLYYGLLHYASFQKSACKLIYLLTRKLDVIRTRVDVVLELHEKNKHAKHTAALLWCFKTYRPECVPEHLGTINISSALKETPKEYKAAFDRIHQNRMGRKESSQTLQWTNVAFGNKRHKQLIASIDYSHIGSDLYREKRRKANEFENILLLGCYQLSLEAPSNIQSYLLNEGGIHILATSDAKMFKRFNYVIYCLLHSVFIQNSSSSYSNRDNLLQQLATLQRYMQQALPAVEHFLTIYLFIWNGSDHKNHIYSLLEYVTLLDFEEFEVSILNPLRSLLLSVEVEEKWRIIHTCSAIVTNMLLLGSNNAKRKESKNAAISRVAQYVQATSKLGELGLRITNGHPLILHSVLSFYETMALFEESNCVIQPACFYWCMFSPELSVLTRVCSLMLGYNQRKTNSEKNVTLLNQYSCDFLNCLITEKAFLKRDQGFIFQDVNLEKEMDDADSAFSLKRNITLLGLGEILNRTYNLENKEFMIIAEEVFPALVLFGRELLSKRRNSHLV